VGKNDRTFNIVGESRRNADGSNRQTEIRRCRAGDAVSLCCEPDNPYDRNAVAVFSKRGIQIGYLSSEHAEWMTDKVARGLATAIIERINGGVAGKPSLGVCLRVNYKGEAVEPPKPRGLLARLFG